ncbi:MAG: AAA family ATPase, partial [Elusimicrobiales bacterium]|nr:AAA family ATPase [Elusimicrobiales bacterium]
YIHGYYEQMITFMRTFLSSAFKDNPYLHTGILTGITRVSKESIFSGLNNLTVDTILDKRFSQYFGLTEEDVKEMLEFYGVPEKMSEVQEWYDGYIFGKREMYNPWSLINYMANECAPRDYWANTSANELAGKLIKNMEQDEKQPLYGLLRGKKVNSSINMNIVYTDLGKDPTLAYGLLAQTGYLKASNAVFELESYYADLEIPNKELQSVFSHEIIKRMADDKTRSAAKFLHDSILQCRPEEMQEEITSFMLASCSYHDLTEEKDYQNLLIGLLGTMRTMYEIKSNRESGHGRSDILLRPKLNVKNADKMPGIIIELKHYKATEEESKNTEKLEERLKQEAEEALRQIDKKDYEAEILSSGCKKVIKYGAAFSGKKAVIIQPPGQQKPKKMPYEEWG